MIPEYECFIGNFRRICHSLYLITLFYWVLFLAVWAVSLLLTLILSDIFYLIVRHFLV